MSLLAVIVAARRHGCLVRQGTNSTFCTLSGRADQGASDRFPATVISSAVHLVINVSDGRIGLHVE